MPIERDGVDVKAEIQHFAEFRNDNIDTTRHKVDAVDVDETHREHDAQHVKYCQQRIGSVLSSTLSGLHVAVSLPESKDDRMRNQTIAG